MSEMKIVEISEIKAHGCKLWDTSTPCPHGFSTKWEVPMHHRNPEVCQKCKYDYIEFTMDDVK